LISVTATVIKFDVVSKSEAPFVVPPSSCTAKPNDVAPEPVKTDDGYIVVSLKEHKTATHEDFDKEHDTYSASLLALKQNEALSYYVRRLRDASKQEIKIDVNNLFGVQKGDAGAPRDEDEE